MGKGGGERVKVSSSFIPMSCYIFG